MLKLGDKNITKLYYGDKVISKAYWGDKLVFQGNKIKFVDYVIFDGNCYIDTGYKPNSNSSIKVTYKPHYNSVFSCIMGTQDSATSNRFYALISSTLYKLQLNSSNSSSFWGVSNTGLVAGSNGTFTNTAQNATLTIDNYNKQISIESEELTKTYNMTQYHATLGTLDCNYNLLLGNRGTAGVLSTANGFKGEISTLEIREQGELVQDLRPCVVNGIVGFYDMVTGKVFTNAGTGTLKASGRFVTSILFDGNSFIDTGITHQTCTIETTVRFEETGTRQLMGFGSGSGQYWGKQANQTTFEYFSGTNAMDKTDVVLEYMCDDPTAPYLITHADGKTRVGSVGTKVTTIPYTIGGLRSTSTTTVISYPFTGEVWGNKITVGGELVQDLRPYVDDNGVACFKDVVTGELFYNKGTGTLGYTEV